MQIVDSTNPIKTFYFTPEAEDTSEVWLVRIIDQETGNHFDNFGDTTDLGYCYQMTLTDADGFMTEGNTYILEIYSQDNSRLIYRSLVYNGNSNPSEELSNNYETI